MSTATGAAISDPAVVSGAAVLPVNVTGGAVARAGAVAAMAASGIIPEWPDGLIPQRAQFRRTLPSAAYEFRPEVGPALVQAASLDAVRRLDFELTLDAAGWATFATFYEQDTLWGSRPFTIADDWAEPAILWSFVAPPRVRHLPADRRIVSVSLLGVPL